MIATKQLYEIIDDIAPFSLAVDWDNVGILVDLKNETEKILFALDVTREVINEAASLGCGIIVSHHPVIFSGIKSLSESDAYVYAVKKGVSVISAHTNFDVAKGGVNDALCELLGFSSQTVFHIGRGVKINKTTGSELAKTVKERLNLTSVGVINPKKTVERVAIVGGAGGDDIIFSAEEGFDALITGEIKHHEAVAAKELSLCVVAAGHFETESPAMAALSKAVQKKIGKSAECLVSKTSVSPYEYII